MLTFTTFLPLHDNHVAKKLAIPQKLTYLELKVEFFYYSGNNESFDKVHEHITFEKVTCVSVLTDTHRFNPTKAQSYAIWNYLDQTNEDELEALCLEYYHDC